MAEPWLIRFFACNREMQSFSFFFFFNSFWAVGGGDFGLGSGSKFNYRSGRVGSGQTISGTGRVRASVLSPCRPLPEIRPSVEQTPEPRLSVLLCLSWTWRCSVRSVCWRRLWLVVLLWSGCIFLEFCRLFFPSFSLLWLLPASNRSSCTSASLSCLKNCTTWVCLPLPVFITFALIKRLHVYLLSVFTRFFFYCPILFLHISITDVVFLV